MKNSCSSQAGAAAPRLHLTTSSYPKLEPDAKGQSQLLPAAALNFQTLTHQFRAHVPSDLSSFSQPAAASETSPSCNQFELQIIYLLLFLRPLYSPRIPLAQPCSGCFPSLSFSPAIHLVTEPQTMLRFTLLNANKYLFIFCIPELIPLREAPAWFRL